MKASRRLQRTIAIDKEIKQLERAKARALGRATNVTPALSVEKVQTSPANTAENHAAEYSDYCLELERKLAELRSEQSAALNIVNTLPFDKHIYKAVLTARYINLQTFEQIAEEMNYSVRHTYRLHGRALAALDGVKRKRQK